LRDGRISAFTQAVSAGTTAGPAMLAKGKLRLEQISLAASLDDRPQKAPLILRRVKISDHEGY